MSLKEVSQSLPTTADFHAAIASSSDGWYRACAQITGDPDLASDAIQDALLKAWSRRKQFHGQSRLDTWIHRIAVNTALDLLRSARPERWEALENDPMDESRRPDDEHENRVLARQFETSLSELSDLERLCVVLKHVEQWPLKEIADQLGSSVGTVKQALFRGIKKLRTELNDLRRTS